MCPSILWWWGAQWHTGRQRVCAWWRGGAWSSISGGWMGRQSEAGRQLCRRGLAGGAMDGEGGSSWPGITVVFISPSRCPRCAVVQRERAPCTLASQQAQAYCSIW
ncbi:hypothetical protein BDU57DRAFT_523824 [Ampelomyces quisqualis]|uniref:Secreted protein n=1 Tax=Ampelomyces quisqualis TaxID=50730 RepID=A0A6A5Q8Q0_AMPQU|nr:hypothetical protein BDU57DRAFT_523824 [Ampelomyces quisqualis]